MAEPDDNQWHLDKKVPISLIAAIMIQTVAIAWWGATLTERVDRLEEISSARQPLVERIARQEALMESVQDTTRRIETKVDRLIDQDN